MTDYSNNYSDDYYDYYDVMVIDSIRRRLVTRIIKRWFTKTLLPKL